MENDPPADPVGNFQRLLQRIKESTPVYLPPTLDHVRQALDMCENPALVGEHVVVSTSVNLVIVGGMPLRLYDYIEYIKKPAIPVVDEDGCTYVLRAPGIVLAPDSPVKTYPTTDCVVLTRAEWAETRDAARALLAATKEDA